MAAREHIDLPMPWGSLRIEVRALAGFLRRQGYQITEIPGEGVERSVCMSCGSQSIVSHATRAVNEPITCDDEALAMKEDTSG